MGKKFRISILLLILAFVAANEFVIKMRSTSWDRTLWVRVYAVSGDDRIATNNYINGLSNRSFRGIEKLINREAKKYGVSINAIEVEYGGRLDSHPPLPPSGRSMLGNIWWSLKFRAWAGYRSWTSDSDDGEVELFVSYYDTKTTHILSHSVGLEGGMIGIINAFADKAYAGSNNLVIAHELLHTLGASDKYDINGQPEHPRGYAQPYRDPLYPQVNAEIMGGKIPLSANNSIVPSSLRDVMVGIYTATEVNWPADQ